MNIELLEEFITAILLHPLQLTMDD